MADPPALIYPGPWHKTTIDGHLAWESPRDVIVQWGAVQVGISTPDDPALVSAIEAAENARSSRKIFLGLRDYPLDVSRYATKIASLH